MLSSNVKIRKAAPGDAESIYNLLNPYSQKNIILERSIENITGLIGSFIVAQSEDKVIGAVSHHSYGANLKEIRSLAVIKKHQHNGTGRRLVKYLLKNLLGDHPDTKIFALSYSPEFFKKIGFVEVDKETLPEKIWQDCVKCKHRDNCGETALVFLKR